MRFLSLKSSAIIGGIVGAALAVFCLFQEHFNPPYEITRRAFWLWPGALVLPFAVHAPLPFAYLITGFAIRLTRLFMPEL